MAGVVLWRVEQATGSGVQFTTKVNAGTLQRSDSAGGQIPRKAKGFVQPFKPHRPI